MLGNELSSLITNIIDFQKKGLHSVVVLQNLKKLCDAFQANAILAQVDSKTPAAAPQSPPRTAMPQLLSLTLLCHRQDTPFP